MEAHESGFPHLHILLRSIWLDQAWLSEQMRDIADSPVVHIQRIDNRARVNAYVAKYTGKAAHKFGNAKRYYFSRDFELRSARKFKPVFDRPGKWAREPGSINSFVANFEQLGYEVERLTARHALASKERERQCRALRPG